MKETKQTRCHRLLQWAAEDLADPIIAADPKRLALERQTVIARLSPHIEEVVQLAYAQLQQGQSFASAEVPKCMQCRHFEKAGMHERLDRCLHPGHGVDPVRGLPIAPACELLRHTSRNQTCGEPGQWFEASTACASPSTEADKS